MPRQRAPRPGNRQAFYLLQPRGLVDDKAAAAAAAAKAAAAKLKKLCRKRPKTRETCLKRDMCGYLWTYSPGEGKQTKRQCRRCALRTKD